MDHRRHKDGSFDDEGEAKFNEFKKLHEKEIQENGIDNLSIDEAYMKEAKEREERLEKKIEVIMTSLGL